MSLSIRDAAAEAPARIGLVCAGRSFTFAELAARLPASPDPAVVGHNDLETFLTIHAHLHARTPMWMIHPRLAMRPQIRPVPEDTLAVIRTSGTSGAPKAALLSRTAFAAAAQASAANLGWRDDDRWLSSLPLAHVGGLGVLVRCLLARRTMVMGTAAEDATIASLVPTQLHRIVTAGVPAPATLRAVLLGGAAASPALVARARALGWPIRCTYGLTEACGQVATQRSPDDAGCGPPLPGTSIRIAEDDTIEIRGPSLLSTYLDHPAPFTPDGFLRTGDLGRLDAGGCLQVFGRRSEIIITGGENVHPTEIEQFLETLPGVDAACVFGIPDEEWGEIVACALVGCVADAPLGRHIAQLAPFQRPRRVSWLPALATTPAGKIDRTTTAALATPRARAWPSHPAPI